jgi:UDPglucose 6-dehydrogenase
VHRTHLPQDATVRATDPQAIPDAKILLPANVMYSNDAYEAAEGADIIMLLTEWDEYVSLDLAKLKSAMNNSPVFIDTRNQYSADSLVEAGFKYIGIGR